MAFSQHLVCSLLGAVLLALSLNPSSAEESNKGNTKKDDMEHLFPLLYLLGGAPTVHSPAVWVMGALSLGAMIFLGKDNIKLKSALR